MLLFEFFVFRLYSFISYFLLFCMPCVEYLLILFFILMYSFFHSVFLTLTVQYHPRGSFSEVCLSWLMPWLLCTDIKNTSTLSSPSPCLDCAASLPSIPSSLQKQNLFATASTPSPNNIGTEFPNVKCHDVQTIETARISCCSLLDYPCRIQYMQPFGVRHRMVHTKKLNFIDMSSEANHIRENFKELKYMGSP